MGDGRSYCFNGLRRRLDTNESKEYLIDKHRNKEIWYRDENFNWQLKKDKSLLSYLIENRYLQDIKKDICIFNHI